MRTINADYLIEKLDLTPHPEGGYFREVYRSDEILERGLPERYKGARSFSTSIYFLLKENEFSAFHKLKSDEIWHFYIGGTIIIHLLREKGEYEHLILGSDLEVDEVPQIVIPKGCWFAAELKDKEDFALAGCSVSPGFDFGDFELGNKYDLILKYPQYAGLINRLTIVK